MVVLIWSLVVMVGENAAQDGHSCPSLRFVLDGVEEWEEDESDKNVQPSAPVRAFDWKGASPFMD